MEFGGSQKKDGILFGEASSTDVSPPNGFDMGHPYIPGADDLAATYFNLRTSERVISAATMMGHSGEKFQSEDEWNDFYDLGLNRSDPSRFTPRRKGTAARASKKQRKTSSRARATADRVEHVDDDLEPPYRPPSADQPLSGETSSTRKKSSRWRSPSTHPPFSGETSSDRKMNSRRRSPSTDRKSNSRRCSPSTDPPFSGETSSTRKNLYNSRWRVPDDHAPEPSRLRRSFVLSLSIALRVIIEERSFTSLHDARCGLRAVLHNNGVQENRLSNDGLKSRLYQCTCALPDKKRCGYLAAIVAVTSEDYVVCTPQGRPLHSGCSRTKLMTGYLLNVAERLFNKAITDGQEPPKPQVVATTRSCSIKEACFVLRPVRKLLRDHYRLMEARETELMWLRSFVEAGPHEAFVFAELEHQYLLWTTPYCVSNANLASRDALRIAVCVNEWDERSHYGCIFTCDWNGGAYPLVHALVARGPRPEPSEASLCLDLVDLYLSHLAMLPGFEEEMPRIASIALVNPPPLLVNKHRSIIFPMTNTLFETVSRACSEPEKVLNALECIHLSPYPSLTTYLIVTLLGENPPLHDTLLADYDWFKLTSSKIPSRTPKQAPPSFHLERAKTQPHG
eukprot:GHVN01014861.1.p1 GENE.GHVN01014861.1~~GHVN01014861.1.p1  ORF type:complete len:622 (+),score=38.67 GHVN01014861.1:207-2072(+)